MRCTWLGGSSSSFSSEFAASFINAAEVNTNTRRGASVGS
jgi:hypothetical protein